jgi:prepilin-type N-terminal cleavage/methylation domain-containing protein
MKKLITSKSGGFTLIELLVVIAIIGILASILLPVLAKAKTKAKAMVGMGNKRQLQMAWQSYTDDNGGDFPKNKAGNWRFNKEDTYFPDTWCPHGPGVKVQWEYVVNPDNEGLYDVDDDGIGTIRGPFAHYNPNDIGGSDRTGKLIFSSVSPMKAFAVIDPTSTRAATENVADRVFWGVGNDRNTGSKVQGKLFLYGQLGSYLGEEGKVLVTPGEVVQAGGKPIIRSVAMNANMGTNFNYPAPAGGAAHQYNSFTQSCQNAGGLGAPNDTFVFIDANMAVSPSPVFVAPHKGKVFNGQSYVCLPSVANGGRYSLSFADGHAEQKDNKNGPRDNSYVDEACWNYLSTVSSPNKGGTAGSVSQGNY